jgi:hypothetical protein
MRIFAHDDNVPLILNPSEGERSWFDHPFQSSPPRRNHGQSSLRGGRITNAIQGGLKEKAFVQSEGRSTEAVTDHLVFP